MIRKINESRKTVILCIGLIFMTMLCLNILTLMVVDDYIYAFSFAMNERITSVWQIFPSMRQHYFTMNGRLVLHFLVQLMLLFPAIVFDLVNAAMFCAMIGLIYYYCCYLLTKKHNAFFILVITGFVWKVVPAFGQVFLWLDGSVNYLWPVVFALFYMKPLVFLWLGRPTLMKRWQQVLYVLVGGIVGALSESLSMVVMAALFFSIIILKFVQKNQVCFWLPIALICCMAGYFAMMISPGTWKSKVEGSSGLAVNFLNVLEKYTEVLLPLIILWLILMIGACYSKIGFSARICSVVFMMISVAINFLHVTANRYPDRSMIGVTVFLIMADMILFAQFWASRFEVLVVMTGVVVILYAGISFFPGSYDILNTYRQCKARENYILEEKEKGNMQLKISLVTSNTPYSAVHNLRYLRTGTYDDWPNVYMAGYFGVNSIEGFKE